MLKDIEQMKNGYSNTREERLYSYITSSGQYPNLNTQKSPMGMSNDNTRTQSIEWNNMMKKQAEDGESDMNFGPSNADDDLEEMDNESLFFQAKVKFQHKKSFNGNLTLPGKEFRSTANAAALEISQYQNDILAIVELDIEEVDDRLEELEFTISRLKE